MHSSNLSENNFTRQKFAPVILLAIYTLMQQIFVRRTFQSFTVASNALINVYFSINHNFSQKIRIYMCLLPLQLTTVVPSVCLGKPVHISCGNLCATERLLSVVEVLSENILEFKISFLFLSMLNISTFTMDVILKIETN